MSPNDPAKRNPSPDDPTPQGDGLPLEGVEGGNEPDIDAQPPGAYVDEESGPVPEPNEPA